MDSRSTQRSETLEVPEENTGRRFSDRMGKDFCSVTQRAKIAT